MQTETQPKIRYAKNSPEYFKMYYEKNKEQIINRQLNNYYEKKKQILNRFNEKILCSCGCEVSKIHMARHCRTNKHLNNVFN